METTPEPKTTGRLIAFYRRANNDMKQEQLAKALGVPTSTVSEIENDKVDLGLKCLQKIAEVLKVPATALMPEESGSHYYSNFQCHAFVNHGYANNMVDGTLLEKLEGLYDKIVALKEETIHMQQQKISALEHDVADLRKQLASLQRQLKS